MKFNDSKTFLGFGAQEEIDNFFIFNFSGNPIKVLLKLTKFKLYLTPFLKEFNQNSDQVLPKEISQDSF